MAKLLRHAGATLPFLLLLLDFWPLGRCAGCGARDEEPTTETVPLSPLRLLLEKIPFFALTAASCLVTFYVQKSGGAMMLTQLTRLDRIANAVISYVRYLDKLFWPRNLAVLYPYAYGQSWGHLLGDAALLAAICVAVVCRRAVGRICWWAGFGS